MHDISYEILNHAFSQHQILNIHLVNDKSYTVCTYNVTPVYMMSYVVRAFLLMKNITIPPLAFILHVEITFFLFSQLLT